MDQHTFDAIGLLFACFSLIIGLAGFAFWLWTLIHAVQNRALNDSERMTWILVIVLGGACGSVIYLIVAAMKRE